MAEDWKRRSDLKSWAISRTYLPSVSVCQAVVDEADDAYQTLEGELSDEELSRLLVSSNLTESDGTGLVAVRLLDTSCGGSGLASCW